MLTIFYQVIEFRSNQKLMNTENYCYEKVVIEMILYFSSTSFRELSVKTNRNYGQWNKIKLYILI